MILKLLKSKIQELTVSESSIDYPGSISLPEELMKAAGIRQFEMVHVNNKTNGNRITTYAVQNKKSGFVTLNGAASKHFEKGDKIHVLCYALLNEQEADVFQPTLVITGAQNELIEKKIYIFE